MPAPKTKRKNKKSFTYSAGEQKKINNRLKTVPTSKKKAYEAAITGRSRTQAVKAFCQMCVGYGPASDIRNCTDAACPLYTYRPYKK
jgi:hypothetical protein